MASVVCPLGTVTGTCQKSPQAIGTFGSSNFTHQMTALQLASLCADKQWVQEEQAARAAQQQGRPQSQHEGTAPRANFCRKCQAWKPARAHHCSATGRCILKLDHFCIWIVNSVGLLNNKFFLLFLFYTALACIEATAALLPLTIRMLIRNGTDAPHMGVMLFASIFTLAFALALLAFLAIHWDMLARNYTSIESIDHSMAASWPYNRGLQRNFLEVFGRRCALLPCMAAWVPPLQQWPARLAMNQAGHFACTFDQPTHHDAAKNNALTDRCGCMRALNHSFCGVQAAVLGSARVK